MRRASAAIVRAASTAGSGSRPSASGSSVRVQGGSLRAAPRGAPGGGGGGRPGPRGPGARSRRARCPSSASRRARCAPSWRGACRRSRRAPRGRRPRSRSSARFRSCVGSLARGRVRDLPAAPLRSHQPHGTNDEQSTPPVRPARPGAGAVALGRRRSGSTEGPAGATAALPRGARVARFSASRGARSRRTRPRRRATHDALRELHRGRPGARSTARRAGLEV